MQEEVLDLTKIYRHAKVWTRLVSSRAHTDASYW